jgi:hypothetical protein
MTAKALRCDSCPIHKGVPSLDTNTSRSAGFQDFQTAEIIHHITRLAEVNLLEQVAHVNFLIFGHPEH